MLKPGPSKRMRITDRKHRFFSFFISMVHSKKKTFHPFCYSGFAAALLFLCCFYLISFCSLAKGIVQTTEQIYSYFEMEEDIARFYATAPTGVFSYRSLGKTGQGRNLYLMVLGNPYASNKILISASIHAREYMASQLVMRMAEHYLEYYDNGSIAGIKYCELFNNTCFYILPMMNPDGISLVQFGTASLKDDVLKEFYSVFTAKQLSQLKANASGVDLNRNFPYGFGGGEDISPLPGLFNYPGLVPLSEKESKVMASLVDSEKFKACINYHTQGRVVYYGQYDNTPQTAIKAFQMAYMVHQLTGYKPENKGIPGGSGSFANYFQTVQDAPSVTIEIGSGGSPVAIDQFDGIFNENLAIWGIIAYYIHEGMF